MGNVLLWMAQSVHSSSQNTISQLRSVTFHMVSHSVTCHPTQANTSRQAGRYST